jgi:hypothetical protein
MIATSMWQDFTDDDGTRIVHIFIVIKASDETVLAPVKHISYRRPFCYSCIKHLHGKPRPFAFASYFESAYF